MKQYWQFDYYRGDCKKTRFFHGTEAALRQRTKKYECDSNELTNLSKSRVEYLKLVKKAHFIDL